MEGRPELEQQVLNNKELVEWQRRAFNAEVVAGLGQAVIWSCDRALLLLVPL
jgi:hypothetical protein